MLIEKDGNEAEVPDALAQMLIKNRGWRISEGRDDAEPQDDPRETVGEYVPKGERPEPKPEPKRSNPRRTKTAAPADEQPAEELELNPNAACDDDLPDGIVFADSAYTTIVDEETGEKIRVLKTHCRNGHEYSPENTKIKLREDKAYRECQTCLASRRARAAAKKTAAEGN